MTFYRAGFPGTSKEICTHAVLFLAKNYGFPKKSPIKQKVYKSLRFFGTFFTQSIPINRYTINRYTINRYENDDFPKKMMVFQKNHLLSKKFFGDFW